MKKIIAAFLIFGAIISDSGHAWAGFDPETAAPVTPQEDVREPAEQGDATSQFMLGFMYANGRGVLQDDKEAFKWYRLAAEQGHAKAQYNLGLMYWQGQGVPRNFVQAHMWWTLSASQGTAFATQFRDNVEGRMTPKQIAEAEKLARE